MLWVDIPRFYSNYSFQHFHRSFGDHNNDMSEAYI